MPYFISPEEYNNTKPLTFDDYSDKSAEEIVGLVQKIVVEERLRSGRKADGTPDYKKLKDSLYKPNGSFNMYIELPPVKVEESRKEGNVFKSIANRYIDHILGFAYHPQGFGAFLFLSFMAILELAVLAFVVLIVWVLMTYFPLWITLLLGAAVVVWVLFAVVLSLAQRVRG